MAIKQRKTTKHGRVTTYYEIQVSGVDHLGKRIQRKRQAPNKTQAIEMERNLLIELQHIKENGYPVLFSDFLSTYLQHIEKQTRKSKASIASEKAALVNHALPLLKKLQLKAVTPAHINTILHHHMENRSGQWKRHCRNFLKALFDLAITHGYLDTNPVLKVPAPRVKKKHKPILNQQQIRKFLQTAQEVTPDWIPHFMLALNALRAGEVRGLQWSAIDWTNNTITIRQSLTRRDGIQEYTKNGCIRIIPMNQELRQILWQLHEVKQPKPTDYVAEQHRQFMKDEQAKVVRAVCREAGIPETDFHRLRSAAITNMYQHGLTSPQIMAISGHKRLSSTQHYYDLSGVQLQGVTDGIELFGTEKEEK